MPANKPAYQLQYQKTYWINHPEKYKAMIKACTKKRQAKRVNLSRRIFTTCPENQKLINEFILHAPFKIKKSLGIYEKNLRKALHGQKHIFEMSQEELNKLALSLEQRLLSKLRNFVTWLNLEKGLPLKIQSKPLIKRIVNGRYDPHNSKRVYSNIKEKIKHPLILNYLNDMEAGINVSGTKKGIRGYARLACSGFKLNWMFGKLKEQGIKDIKKCSESDIISFFNKMRAGQILRKDGKQFLGIRDYVKTFKAFWHWHQKVNRKKGIEVQDITLDLNADEDKPKWVFFNIDDLNKMVAATDDLKLQALMMFLFDTGIRFPTETLNVRVQDLSPDFNDVLIKESKTFQRQVKLRLCKEILKKYVLKFGLRKDDFLFNGSLNYFKNNLREIARRVFPDEISRGREHFYKISYYDFRHSSCCYWLNQYSSTQALCFKFGWKDPKKIWYYSEFLNVQDKLKSEGQEQNPLIETLMLQLKTLQEQNQFLINKLMVGAK
jgi:integrase